MMTSESAISEFKGGKQHPTASAAQASGRAKGALALKF
jgi:hypothetical protein